MEIRLKDILGIDYKRSCFCGRPVIGNICEVHGSDIKISTKIIHSQFEIHEQEKPNALVNLSLTENQFVNLFQKKLFENSLEQVIKYKINISAFGSEKSSNEIIDEFIDLLEYDEIFGKKRVKEIRVTNSGVTVNYLINFLQQEDQSLIFIFEILLTRLVKDYIDWRSKQFKSKKETIKKSLLTTRNKVITKRGKEGKIIDVNWKEEERNVKQIKLLVNGKEEFAKLSELYQFGDDFYINPRVERRIISALRSYSQSFFKSFKQFLRKYGLLAEIEKMPDEEKASKYKKLIGKRIILPAEEFEILKEAFD